MLKKIAKLVLFLFMGSCLFFGVVMAIDNEGLSFITEWGPIDSTTTITVPLAYETYHFRINWGDGTPPETYQGHGSELKISHDYTSFFERVDVSITPLEDSGKTGFPRIRFGSNSKTCTKLKNIKQWGELQWTSMESAFKYCSSLNGTAVDVPDLSHVENMNYMFYGASSFNGNISNWNTSNVKSMVAMLQGASSFKGDISDWNTAQVNYMNSMFNNARSFNQDLSQWNISQIEAKSTCCPLIINGDIPRFMFSGAISMTKSHMPSR